MKARFALFLLVVLLMPCMAAAKGGAVRGTVVNASGGAGVEDAVIVLRPAPGKSPPAAKRPFGIMDQWQKQFIPYVLPVKVGTAISFPNKDKIKHHVYSFSEPKPFELKLYSGYDATPIVFDKPGVVTLGCNIHDWMLGFIYVVDSDYFGKTGKNGSLVISGVPPGEYIASVWQPNITGDPASFEQKISVTDDGEAEVRFTISLKRDRRRPTPPDSSEGLPYGIGR